MKPDANHVKLERKPYTVERRFLGTRTAEEIVTALIKAHL